MAPLGKLRGYWCDADADGYRLPTEEEWEYACRAGAVTDFHFGDDVDLLPQYAHIGSVRTAPVGKLLPNRFGQFDMHGNVCEWCWNGDREYSSKPYAAEVPRVSQQKVVHRGGSWFISPRWAVAGYRGEAEWNHARDHNMGFRVLCPPANKREPSRNKSQPHALILHDFNGDGAWSADDAPLHGISAYVHLNRNRLPDEDEPHAFSDELGELAFPDLPAGEYVVRPIASAPWIVEPASAPLVVSSDGVVTSANFRMYLGQYVSGQVYVDLDGDGRRDNLEPAIAGARVYVVGEPDSEVLTGDDGEYKLWRVPGSYRFGVTLPEGYQRFAPATVEQSNQIYSGQPHAPIDFDVKERTSDNAP